MEEVEKHNTVDDAWIVVKGAVFDVSAFVEDHPGGKNAIQKKAGTDATTVFTSIHSEKAWGLLEKYYLGDLAKEGQAAKL